MDIIKRDESYNIIGACIEVHKKMGSGFFEKVYQDCLAIEFNLRGIPYEREKHITIKYKGNVINHDYYADFFCYDSIIVELKAVNEINSSHKAQILNYLSATNAPLGLLINFGEESLKYYRFPNYKASTNYD